LRQAVDALWNICGYSLENKGDTIKSVDAGIVSDQRPRVAGEQFPHLFAEIRGKEKITLSSAS